MKSQRGQALVETAIVLPLLVLLIMGLFEYGRYMYLRNTLNNAARSGARAASVTPLYNATTNPDGMASGSSTHTLACDSSEFAASNGAVYRSICNSIFNGIPKNEVVVSINYTELAAPAGLSPGDSVDLSLTWDKYEAVLPLLTPITNLIIGQASMRYE